MMSRKKYLKEQGISLLLLSVILDICNCNDRPLFNNYPDYRTYTGEGSSSAIKISSDNIYVMVGYSSGNAKIYYIGGSLYSSCNGHNSPIIEIEQIPNNGWITLDSSGKAIRWSIYGTQQYVWTFSSYATDMSVTSLNGNYWVAFNFGNSIIEYNALTYSNTTTQIFYSTGYYYFLRIQYPAGHSYLYACTNTSYVYQYDCSTGNYTTNSWFTYYPTTDIDLVPGGNKQVVILNSFYIIKLKNYSYGYDLATYSEYANQLTTSYYNGEISYILVNSNSSQIYVHSTTGSLKQTITYNYNKIKAIDASNTYLLAVDEYGYLLTFSYSSYHPDDYTPANFPGWAIALITSFFFFICVVGFVMMVVKARKRRQRQTVNNYNRFNNQPINPPYFPNNKPFNVPSGQQISGNSTNPQPAWHSNPQPFFNTYTYTQPNQPQVLPIQQNPYQTNQPSNWS